MKIIPFTAVEVLPALLNKTKTSTIRPAWKTTILTNNKMKGIEKATYMTIMGAKGKLVEMTIGKPPRFKVGEQVKLLWNQRSKYKWFCKWCGGALIPNKENDMSCKKCLNTVDRNVLNNYEMYHRKGQTIPKAIIFNKLLGTAEITEVFKIFMVKYDLELNHFQVSRDGTDWAGTKYPLLQDLAKRDGFVDAESMFKYFDKNYDLSNAKEFYVYRYKWHTQKK